MNLTDRLRGVLRPPGHSSSGISSPSSPFTSADGLDDERVSDASDSRTARSKHRCVAEVLGGEWRESHGHSYVTVDHRYAVGYRLGRVSVGECLPKSDGSWPELPLLLGNAHESSPPTGRMLFVDLETTGLAGGAGTCAFLVGVGWFDDTSFRVRQFLLTSYSAERALLQDVASLAAEAGTLVTYNGKTFDLPLIETRFLFHRMTPPFGGVPHLDMLHRARRLWRAPSSVEVGADPGDHGQNSCRLSSVEASVLGYVREGDVSGFEAPARYFHFVRSGDARPLSAVCEHNRLDLLSLAMLTATAATLLQEGPEASRTAHEALGLGRLYEMSGLTDKARQCFSKAASFEGASVVRGVALRAYAVSCRRARRFDDAADAWRRILELDDCPAAITKDATDALAVHHEHRLRDLRTARRFAVQALELSVSGARHEAARHRVARLERKLTPTGNAAPLFG
jgi:uncharacterized protein YprB with RNaseH-like and TPR domain